MTRIELLNHLRKAHDDIYNEFIRTKDGILADDMFHETMLAIQEYISDIDSAGHYSIERFISRLLLPNGPATTKEPKPGQTRRALLCCDKCQEPATIACFDLINYYGAYYCYKCGPAVASIADQIESIISTKQ